jgi:hypothetical protein
VSVGPGPAPGLSPAPVNPYVVAAAGDEGGAAWPAGTRFVERATFRDGGESAEWYVLRVAPGAFLPPEAVELRGYEPGSFKPEKLVAVILALAAVAFWHLTHAFGAWEAAPLAVLAAVLAFLYVPESAGYDRAERVRFARVAALPDEVQVGAVQRLGLWRAERDLAVTALAPGLWWLLGAVAGPFGATTGVLGAAVLAWSGAEMLRRRDDGGEDDELETWSARNVIRAAPRIMSEVSAFTALGCVQIVLFQALLGDSSLLERALMVAVAAAAAFQKELRGRGGGHPRTPKVPTRRWLGAKGRAFAGVVGFAAITLALTVGLPAGSTALRGLRLDSPAGGVRVRVPGRHRRPGRSREAADRLPVPRSRRRIAALPAHWSDPSWSRASRCATSTG